MYDTGSTQARDLKMHLVVMEENEDGPRMVVIRVGHDGPHKVR
jgi:hypothetical protein